ncbi:MAG TPA: DciA family protein [Amaricoccus sp.]|nr:DciA family protein [Amaricoccus sp.]
MGADDGRREGKGNPVPRPERPPGRVGRGFVRAGGLIEPQMRTAAARRGFAQARLRALWPEIAGPEFAAICAPVKLARARGPAGGLLTVAVAGAHAPQLQMLLPLLRERVNAALGAGSVGRIQLTQAAHGFAEAQAPYAAASGEAPHREADLGEVRGSLSSIGDGDLREALETLARNVLSRAKLRQP